ncbi:MMPL family transporter [Halobacteriaceae archaeon SHR40]|uniref:efflux RND transporter permease subunit n=1 Tax=Halovenus amylolytica TaxID=2500550 RepID=UPI000FE4258C
MDEEGVVGGYTGILVRYSRVLGLALVLTTAVVGAGVLVADSGLEITPFEVDSPEERAYEDVQSRFVTDDRSYSQVVVRENGSENDTLSPERLLETLALQEAIRTNETVNRTLSGTQPTMGVANAIAISSDPRIGFDGAPPIDLQVGVLENRTDELNRRVLGLLLAGDVETPGDQPPVSTLLPEEYDHGNATATAQLIVVVHDGGASDAALARAQRTIETLAGEHVSAETFVVGRELAVERGAAATGESFRLVGPLLLVVVVVLLSVAYRDPVDVALSVLGIGLVLLWTAGLAGWLGVTFTQLLVAVPALLVGLSIDYSLHTAMRYREAQSADRSLPADTAMARGLGGVLPAIAVTTATTAIGFLTGLFSPITMLRDFGVVAALGVCSALIVFGALIPALRLEIERLRPGESRRLSVGSLPKLTRPLRVVAVAADRAPVLLVVLAVVSAAGAVGAAELDTTTDRNDFLPEEPPAWMDVLPGPLQPTDYGIRSDAAFVADTFQDPTDPTVDILVTGNVTDPSTLMAVSEAAGLANESSVTVEPVDRSGTVTGPMTAIETVADNDTFAGLVAASDTDGDGIPDRNLTAVYDAAFEGAPETAGETIARGDGGEYEALRLVVTIDEDAEGAVLTREMRSVAARIDAAPTASAVATGLPVLDHLRSRAILETVLSALLVGLGAITVLLTGVFRLRWGSWILGIVAVAPVALSLAWLIGTMSLLSIPFNAETSLLAAISIGMGTDYTVHITERYLQERHETGRQEALKRTLVETGGVVFASAATTAGAFAVLWLTPVPSLQRFGVVTGLAISFAFLASITVLPGLLVLLSKRE